MLKIIDTKEFIKLADAFIKRRQLLQQDLNDLKDELAKDPELGDLIVGTGGVRKARLKSATGGKRGGFRLCYYVLTNRGWLYLLFIYPKNEQENLTSVEKKILKEFVSFLKGASNV